MLRVESRVADISYFRLFSFIFVYFMPVLVNSVACARNNGVERKTRDGVRKLLPKYLHILNYRL